MAFPQELKQMRRWVNYRLIPDETGEKPKKMPINPITGKSAKSNDPSTWTDYLTAVDAVERYGFTGIGFMFTKEDGFVGVDIDHCYDPHRKTFAPRRPPFSPGSRPLQLNFHNKKARLFRRLRREWLALWED